MKKQRRNYPIIESLEITDVAAEGKSLGRYNDLVVFVPFTVPGDVVNVQINSSRRRFMEGYVVDYIKHSPFKIEPFCAHYGSCGGCKWQSLPYEKQLEYKQQQVEDQLKRIAKVELPEIAPILGSKETRYYRNKLEYTFSSKKWITQKELQALGGELPDQEGALGFHVGGMFDKILSIQECYLQPEPSNSIRLEIERYTKEHNYSYYDMRSHEGLMRNLVIRTSTTGDLMLIVIFAYEDTEKRIALLEHIKTQFPQITSLIYIINSKLNDSYADQTPHLYSGESFIMEDMDGMQSMIGPKSFYQTNSNQAYELYKVVREFCGLTGAEVVYDLYTGTGTIANFISAGASKVVGIEYVAEAIEDAKANSKINNITNTSFFAGDMKDVLSDSFIRKNGHPNIIILDPPRAGIHEDVANTILRAAPESIVYVSCNPATQARDIAIFGTDYFVDRVQPVDMFPHTHHLENVVLLKRRQK